jgi:hypothetical protein
MTTKRWALIAGSAGLVAGLALGVTGFAGAATPKPTPSAGEHRFGHDLGGKGGMGHRLEGFQGRGGGLVSSVSATSLTLATPAGSKTIGLTGSTAFYKGQTKATSSVVKVGDIVRIRLVDPKATKPVASVVTVVPAHLSGFVTKINGSTITLVDESGFTRTLRTSSATVYVKRGATGSASDITVGAFIRAIGSVAGDGTTLDATKVGTGLPGHLHDGPDQTPTA